MKGDDCMRKKAVLFLAGALALLGTAVWANIPKARTLDFDYHVAIANIPPGAKELKVWLPFLSDTPYQEVVSYRVEPREFAVITKDKTYNNKILNYTIRSPGESRVQLSVRYRVKRYEYSNKPGPGQTLALAQEDMEKYLKPNRLVTLSPRVRDLAREVTAGKETTVEKARAIYEYVFQTVAYDKTAAGWGKGDTERVCLIKSGNCTDFHSLFISLARAVDIPAKFVIGVPVSPDKSEGDIPGYHCWAEFFDERAGWIPVDISEAWKKKEKVEYYFGTIGEDRLELSIGRDIVLEPLSNAEPLNYFVYPYAEIDGSEFTDLKTSFHFKDVDAAKGGGS